MKQNEQHTEGRSAGKEIIEGLTAFRDAVHAGQELDSRFTVRDARHAMDTTEYSSTDVRRTRERLGASQTMFAKLIGLSPRAVQALEGGQRPVNPTLSRLLDEINRNPEDWIRRYLQPTRS